jgi:large subunit ribosomal protein L35
MPRFETVPGGTRHREPSMPKMKTNKAVSKRFKITKKGKVRRYKAGVGHLNSAKTRKRKRHLRHPSIHTGKQTRTIKRLLGLC